MENPVPKDRQMTDEEIRRLIHEVSRQAATQAVAQTFMTLGLDINNPIEAQADMHHLRSWRKAIKNVQTHVFNSVLGTIVLGVLGLIYLAFQPNGGK